MAENKFKALVADDTEMQSAMIGAIKARLRGNRRHRKNAWERGVAKYAIAMCDYILDNAGYIDWFRFDEGNRVKDFILRDFADSDIPANLAVSRKYHDSTTLDGARQIQALFLSKAQQEKYKDTKYITYKQFLDCALWEEVDAIAIRRAYDYVEGYIQWLYYLGDRNNVILPQDVLFIFFPEMER